MEENLDFDLNLDFEIPNIELQETTVGNLAGERMGCGNIYKGSYDLPDGKKAENWVCELVPASTEIRFTVGKGSIFEINEKRFEIINILPKQESKRGKVIIKEL